MGILLFVLEYMYISLLLKMINGFFWPGKIMASPFKDCRMGPSDKVSLWYVALIINTRFRFFILEKAIVKRI